MYSFRDGDHYWAARNWVRNRNDDFLDFFYSWLVPIHLDRSRCYDEGWTFGALLIVGISGAITFAPLLALLLLLLFICAFTADIWTDNVHGQRYPMWVVRLSEPALRKTRKWKLRRTDKAAYQLLKVVEQDLKAWRGGRNGPYRWANLIYDLRTTIL